MVQEETLLERIRSVREGLFGDDGKPSGVNLGGPRQTTIAIIELVYGSGCEQVRRFVEEWKPQERRDTPGSPSYQGRLTRLIDSVLEAAEADLEAGLAKSRAVLAKGEVLGDFVALSRRALDENSSDADAVAAVLAAASLEDALKQLGEINGVAVAGRELRGTVQKLKDAGLLEGARGSIADGFVDYRNAALHGEFSKVDRAATQSVLSFVEGILVEAFS